MLTKIWFESKLLRDGAMNAQDTKIFMRGFELGLTVGAIIGLVIGVIIFSLHR